MDEHGQDLNRDSAPRLAVTTGPGGEVVLAGEVDLYNANQLTSALQEATHDQQALTADLQAVTYLDSAGVAVLFEVAGLFEQPQPQLRVLVRAGSAVAAVLGICGLSHVAEVQALPVAGHPDGEKR